MLADKADGHFELVRWYYDEAQSLCGDNPDLDEFKTKAQRHQNEADQRYNNYQEMLRVYYSREVSSIMESFSSTMEDSLQLYHQFAKTCAESIHGLRPKAQIQVCSDEILRRRGAAQYFLDEILEVVKKSYERDCTLRRQLHGAVDGLFD